MYRFLIVFVACACLTLGCESPPNRAPANPVEAPAKAFDFNAGRYGTKHPRVKELWSALGKSTLEVDISGHAGIALPDEKGKGTEQNMSLERLKQRVSSTRERRQATIFEQKNVIEENTRRRVVELLTEAGFEIIVVQRAHSWNVIIEEVIRN